MARSTSSRLLAIVDATDAAYRSVTPSVRRRKSPTASSPRNRARTRAPASSIVRARSIVGKRAFCWGR
jgi:hypothetical protein